MDVPKFDRKRFDELVDRGLPSGVGDTEKACIMACLNLACGGSLTDAAESPCVLPAARAFAIRLNDSRWSSDKARADGLRDLGIALLGTSDLDRLTFVSRLSRETIRVVVPIALRAAKLEEAAALCEREPTRESALRAKKAASDAADAYAYAASDAAYAYAAAYAASDAAYAYAAAYASASAAASAAAYAAYAADDRALVASAQIATRILLDMRAEADAKAGGNPLLREGSIGLTGYTVAATGTVDVASVAVSETRELETVR